MPTMAFFGSSLVSSYWNGAATYYRGIIRALDACGWRVTFFEPDAYDRQAHRDIPDPPWADVIVYPATPEGVEEALERARRADVLVKASGIGVFDDWLAVAIPELRQPWQAAIYWDVDAPATLAQLAAEPEAPLRAAIPRFDRILTYGGGPPVVAAYRALGARDCTPIYNALDPDTHHPVAPSPRYGGDLGLLANRLPDREARIAEFFFRAARALPDRRFTLGGSGWTSGPDSPVPRNVHCLGHVPTPEHNAFNSSPTAVLNVNRDSMARVGYSPATRIFEAAGAGACIISDAWDGLDIFLDPTSEILVARDGAEVAELLRGLTPARARAIGQAARARVLAHHTYAHRVTELRALLGDTLVRRPACARA